MPEYRSGYKTALYGSYKKRSTAKQVMSKIKRHYGSNRLFIRKYKNKYQVRIKL